MYHLKGSKFQNEFMKLSFLPKCEQKIDKGSTLIIQGRNSNNFSFVFWEKFWNLLIFKNYNLFHAFGNPQMRCFFVISKLAQMRNSFFKNTYNMLVRIWKWLYRIFEPKLFQVAHFIALLPINNKNCVRVIGTAA